jgi:predicted metal-dependent hydrolase
MNHSARFWAIVEDIFPDYQKRRKKLKELQRRLSGENWE